SPLTIAVEKVRGEVVRFAFIVSETLSGIRRNLSMVISVVLVTFISLTFVGSAGLLQMQINQMKGYWYDRAEVAILLCNGRTSTASCAGGTVPDSRRVAIEAQSAWQTAVAYVECHEYESQEQALDWFQEQYSNVDISESESAEHIPESFRVSLV